MERRTSFNLRMVSLFCGNWVLHYQWSPIATAALRRRSNLMPIRFRTTTVRLIGFSSEH